MFLYRGADLCSLWGSFGAHVDEKGMYHKHGMLVVEKDCCSYSFFTLHVPPNVKEETFESCCCQQCFCCNVLCDKMSELINIAHDPKSMAAAARTMTLKCEDPTCPARGLCNKVMARMFLPTRSLPRDKVCPTCFAHTKGPCGPTWSVPEVSARMMRADGLDKYRGARQ